MTKKRVISLIAACTLVLTMGTTSVFAASSTKASVCPYKSCSKTYKHKHHGKHYQPHHAKPGRGHGHGGGHH